MNPTYDDMIAAIRNYYGGVSGQSLNSIWNRMNLGLATYDEIEFAYTQIPQIQTMISPSGRILGIDYADPIYITVPENSQNIISDMTSNYGGASNSQGYNNLIPSNWGGGGGSDYTVTGGAKIPGSGGISLATIADKASLAVTGTSIGAKLGMKIDSLLYNLDPEWWDTNFPTINPETWDSICVSEGGKSFMRTLFGIPNNTPTAYAPEEWIAYTYQLLRDTGSIDGNIEASISSSAASDLPLPNFRTLPLYKTFYWEDSVSHQIKQFSNPSSSDVYIANVKYNTTTRTQIGTWVFSKTSGQTIDDYNSGTGHGPVPVEISTSQRTYNNTQFYTRVIFNANTDFSDIFVPAPYDITGFGEIDVVSLIKQIGTIIFDGSVSTTTTTPGITKMNNTQAPYGTPSTTIINGTTTADVLRQLKENYPDLFDGSITTSTLQDDGTIIEDTYVPIPFPNVDEITQDLVTTEDMTQTDVDVNPNTFVDITTSNPTDNPPDTGTGSTDSIVTPSGSASSLWAIYNPTQAEVNAFGAWLWSSDFVEQLKKLFNDPMQAIIGIHKVFVTPTTGGTRNIICGYLDSGVSSKYVTQQYTTINCGTVSLAEYFGNVFDYSPYTEVKLFLPFIGIVPLDVGYVMRSKINVTYTVDVITGACLANVKVSRDGGGGVIYTYSGSAIVSYPISSGSYTGVVAGALSLAAGVAGTIASGGALAPAVLGAASSIGRMKTQVQHSGQFSGAAGAMGGKKPYLIISRPQTRVADYVNNFSGLGANSFMPIGNCQGYFKCLKVHLIINNAYKNELQEIESLLLNGVLMHHKDIGNDPIIPTTVRALNVTQNGVYNVPSGYVGFNPVTINVANSYSASDEGKVVSNGELVSQTSDTVTENDTYDTTLINSLTVNVPSSSTLITKNITQNGTYNASADNADGYSQVTVNVSGGGTSHFCDVDFTKGNFIINNVTYDSNGATFPSTYNGYILIPFARAGMTIIFDVTSMTLASGSHRRFVMGTASTGFIYRSTGVWSFYASSTWENTSITDGSYFDNSTVKVYIDDQNKWHIYKDNVLVFEPAIALAPDVSACRIGSNFNSIYNTVISNLIVY